MTGWVLDASVVAELLFGTARGRRIARLIQVGDLFAPQHLTAEVASVVRGWSLGGHISDDQARRAFEELEFLDIEQVPMLKLLPEVFALRHNLSAYDAMYVVLARKLGLQLLTLDARLARAATDCALIPE